MNRIAVIFVAITIGGCHTPPSAGPQRLASARNLVSGVPSRTADGAVHVVVEIPAGTNAKWEVAKDGDGLVWELRDGRPRVVQYLAYPANYGMVPGTRLALEAGGDGDPLDVLMLGPARERGAIVPSRLIGVLRLRDRGEQDDKLIAVDLDGPLGDVTGLADLERRFPGAGSIVETWFAHYKGPGKIEMLGFAERDVALEILAAAERAYREETGPASGASAR